MLGLREGTSEEDVRSAANKVSKIKLWSQQQLGTGGEGMMRGTQSNCAKQSTHFVMHAAAYVQHSILTINL
eukprot:g27166.t1